MIEFEHGPVQVKLAWVAVLLLAFVACPRAYAGPPFQTDDPEPVGFRHYEAYLFGTFDRAAGSTFSQLPAMEFNWGAAPNLQVHMILPGAYLSANGAYGMGDAEFGLKYRFVQEGANRPEVGVFPLLELPSGNNRLGLGSGQVWARLPIWAQKSFGPWTTYGGIGYQINHAAGMKDSVFAGWLLQRQITKRLTLGGEGYHQGAQIFGGRQSTFVDAGGYYNFRQNLSLLFMLGHTVSGERHKVGYLGLYYTWGRGRG
ncbi:MAG TPA: transporter [Candidatus Dormibacteraeota bacterium]|nr:transporter [Candidatus Dormibacteraeota bacterium]